MKSLRCLLLILFVALCTAQNNRQPKPQDATAAMIHAFDTHNIVMFGEYHGNKQEHEWLRKLVSTPEFADRVDDIVMEFGNSLYQKSVDRYIAGEDVPFEQVQKAWRNVVGAIGPPSPVYEWFYRIVRETNLKRRGKHQMRVVLGDPYADWDKIKDREDLGPYLANRDQWYAQVVKDEVLAKNHRALLIMGAGHFLRSNGPGYIEQQLRTDGAIPYFVVFGTNAVGGFDDLDKRFDSWPVPAIVAVAGNWVGDLPAMPVFFGGTQLATPLKLGEAADALLYVGPRDTLTKRDRVAKIACYIFGGIPIAGLIYFARIPRPSSLDFRAQMALSQFAFWMAIASGVVFFGGFFRADPEIRILTIIYGIAMCFLWVIIAAAHLPVS